MFEIVVLIDNTLKEWKYVLTYSNFFHKVLKYPCIESFGCYNAQSSYDGGT